MKKKVLSVAIALAALCGIPAMAQSNNTNTTCTTKTEQTATCGKTAKINGQARGNKQNAYQEVFAGLNLTDAQKTALEALRPQRPGKAQGEKTEKVKGQKNDSTAAARPNRAQVRRDYVNGVKNILTPDQYVVFLENVVVNDAQIPGGRQPQKMAQSKNNKRDGQKQFGNNSQRQRSDKQRQNKQARNAKSAQATQSAQTAQN